MFERFRLLTPAPLFALSVAACSGSARAPVVEPTPERTPSRAAARSVHDGQAPVLARPDHTYDGKPALSRQTGEATYYGGKFEGRSTASGERYDPRAHTAAHLTLPFGTVVRVIRADDPSKVAYVRVNDRGPHGSKKRIIDLSRAAAADLAMLGDGIVTVRLEVVEYGKRDEHGKHRTHRRRTRKH